MVTTTIFCGHVIVVTLVQCKNKISNVKDAEQKCQGKKEKKTLTSKKKTKLV